MSSSSTQESIILIVFTPYSQQRKHLGHYITFFVKITSKEQMHASTINGTECLLPWPHNRAEKVFYICFSSKYRTCALTRAN